uniref:Uncharacterized protein n=1 Tax=Heterorhabditis bacteriophora TaxID=37862 RepID=A0A1I7X2R2_HETBA
MSQEEEPIRHPYPLKPNVLLLYCGGHLGCDVQSGAPECTIKPLICDAAVLSLCRRGTVEEY